MQVPTIRDASAKSGDAEVVPAHFRLLERSSQLNALRDVLRIVVPREADNLMFPVVLDVKATEHRPQESAERACVFRVQDKYARWRNDNHYSRDIAAWVVK